jgi:hypothetical protein
VDGRTEERTYLAGCQRLPRGARLSRVLKNVKEIRTAGKAHDRWEKGPSKSTDIRALSICRHEESDCNEAAVGNKIGKRVSGKIF